MTSRDNYPFFETLAAGGGGGAPVNASYVVAQNEGFIIRATVPATGTWTASFDVTWMELASY